MGQETFVGHIAWPDTSRAKGNLAGCAICGMCINDMSFLPYFTYDDDEKNVSDHRDIGGQVCRYMQIAANGTRLLILITFITLIFFTSAPPRRKYSNRE